MAVPASVTSSKSLNEFQFGTLLHLLLCRDLRLISVWHPSFLTLLLDALPDYWDRLLHAIGQGSETTPALPRRARELRALKTFHPEALWPSLRVISCWADAAAVLPFEQLRKRFPNVALQPKGLIATEGFVSLPFQGQYPVAVLSHFFEFIDSRGRVRLVEELREPEEYEVVLTSSGGLWRYRLGDRVRVTGFLERTPCIKFIGRGEDVSDRFGEKLSEGFVSEIFKQVFGTNPPRFALLAPDETDSRCCYTLYLEGALKKDWPEALEDALRRNPHYAYCRDLGQLSPLRVFLIHKEGYEAYAERLARNGTRLGGIKPRALSQLSGWNDIFDGSYAGTGASWPGLCCRSS